MKLSRRWKIGLAITAYAALVLTMAWYSRPNALRGARAFEDYQNEQTLRMLESAQEHAMQEQSDSPAGDAPDR
jgi:hypothetical protein